MFYLPLGLIRRRDEPRDRARDRVMQHAVPQATAGQGSGCPDILLPRPWNI